MPQTVKFAIKNVSITALTAIKHKHPTAISCNLKLFANNLVAGSRANVIEL